MKHPLGKGTKVIIRNGRGQFDASTGVITEVHRHRLCVDGQYRNEYMYDIDVMMSNGQLTNVNFWQDKVFPLDKA